MGNRSINSRILFLVGLFCQTDIYVAGYLSISEFFMFLFAPFVFLKNINNLRRDGVMPFLALTSLTMFGCFVSTRLNHNPMAAFLRGFFSVYAIFAIAVCLHALLRKDFFGIRWLLLGNCLSMIINIFIFQAGSTRGGVDASFVSAVGMTNTVGYALFWTIRIKAFLLLPIMGWYKRIPRWYSIPAVLFLIIFGLVYSGGSGRSSAMCSAATCLLLFFGSAKRIQLMKLKKHIVWVLVVLIFLGAAFKAAYKHLAAEGMLGEYATEKYEKQTRRGNDMLSLLIGGRVEFFAGAYACLLKPIVGYGPWALDYGGIYGEFLSKYGVDDDYKLYLDSMQRRENSGKLMIIPAHSHIICFWLWYGIFGLIFWLYVLLLLANVFFKCLPFYPPWYGYVACTLPGYLWNVFFSPFGGRVMTVLMIVVCLLLRASANRRLPPGGVLNPYYG